MSGEELSSPRSLDVGHYDLLSQALRNVLHTDVAVETYAQLIDGLPLQETCQDNSRNTFLPYHPANAHKELCSGARDKAISLRAGFAINDLAFGTKLLEAFNAAPLLTKSCNRLLVELTARALHQIGVNLFLKKDKLHDPQTTNGLSITEVTKWQSYGRVYRPQVPSTLFFHHIFKAEQQYPNGAADVAGYWAEDRILGGVPIFDQSQSWDEESEPNIYFQSSRSGTPFDAWQLLDRQQERLLAFLLCDKDDFDSITRPIPILPRKKNKVRVDEETALVEHKIYRDLYERPPPPERPSFRRRLGPCVIYPRPNESSDSDDSF